MTSTDNLAVGKKVLLTGGSGFIASHVLDALLDAGFEVVVTTRSVAKGQGIVDNVKEEVKKSVSYSIVEDISKEGAFDAVLQSQPFDYVVHTASPYHLNVQDPVKDFLDPAIKGTTGLLKSIKEFAPTVKRVVITSSSAAILNPGKHEKVYDESHWAEVTWEQAMEPQYTYKASKVLSERAAWSFIETEKPPFDLATINNTYTFGPIQRGLPDLTAMNTSNHRIRDLAQGKMRAGLAPTAPVFTFVDVRDVAAAHARALTAPGAGGQRFYVVAGHFSNKRVADVMRARFPALRRELPLPEATRDDLPDDVYQFDNGKSRRVLGLEYRGLEEAVVDTVQSILEHRQWGL